MACAGMGIGSPERRSRPLRLGNERLVLSLTGHDEFTANQPLPQLFRIIPLHLGSMIELAGGAHV